MNSKIYDLKIDVSCEASVNLHHISQNATPATEFARCHHLTQPWQCDPQKHATRHVWSAAPATQNDDGGLQSVLRLAWIKCNSSPENDAKALRLPQKAAFDTLWKM